MKRIFKKLSLIVLALACLFAEIPFQLFADDSQVIKPGGSTTSTQLTQDGVSMSKTIEKTDKENYFDITLEVKTETLVDEIEVDQDLAIVLVLDTSSSMTWCTTPGGATSGGYSKTCRDVNDRRIKVAKDAIYKFTDKFFEGQSEDAVRQLGLVTFNKTANKIVYFTDAASSDETKFNNVVSAIDTGTGTNLADGLKQGAELLATTPIKNKYLIVLTDGYPTVECDRNKDSIDTCGSNGVAQNDYGNYAARLAAAQAETNRKAGVKTFTIGVGLNSQRSYEEVRQKYAVGYTTNVTQTTPTSGTYNFSSNVITNKEIVIVREDNSTALSVDNNNNVISKTLPNPPTANDLWIIEAVTGGYKLKNKKTGTYLSRDGSDPILNTTGIIFQAEKDDNNIRFYYYYNNNKYYLRTNSNGNWRITNSNSRINLHIGTYTEPTPVETETYTTTPAHFKLWLGGQKVIGSALDSNGKPIDKSKVEVGGIGYVGDMTDENGKPVEAYYDAENVTALENAYTTIFQKIKIEVDKLNKAWVATDPMNATLPEYITFEGFYSDDNNDKISDTIANELEYGDNSLNNASFSNDSINWNLRESKPYKTEPKPNGKEDEYIFTYQLKYRIRLNNEVGDFVDDLGEELATNGAAKLTYAVTDSEGNITELRTENFKVPTVIGYLGTLEFTKLSEDESTLLKGAKFELVHDDENCECKIYKDGVNEKDPATSSDFENITATSNENGKVIFNKVIPSGHTYILREKEAPNNHVKSDKTYKVNVSYGTVTVYDGDNELIPESEINYFDVINKLDEGKLEVTKKLQDEHIDSNKTFEFELETNTVRDSYTWTKYDSNGTQIGSGTTQIVDGKASFTLKHNEKISIVLPLTTKYKITEKNNPNYDVNYTNREGVITKNTTSNVIVKNTTKPTYIDVHKTWKNTVGFTTLPSIDVTLYKKYGNGSWTEVETQTLSASNNWYYKWERLNGEYEYKVDEDEIPEFFVKEVSCDSESKHCEITNTNTAGVDLPKTGSSAMLILVLMSTSMMLFSFVYGCKYYLKK